MLVDLHLRLYAIENLATRSHLENNNGNIIKQADVPDLLCILNKAEIKKTMMLN